ncbi:MAG: SRPBCC domain-containing protein [Flavobacteriales bacterium]|nr:SRPBCC domain-containing protein [Flavobacteriales bacterium]
MNKSDREIIISRTVKATRSIVWQAWTDPAHVDHWFGPNGFTNKTLSMDVRIGGQWKFTMTSGEGRVFENLVTYTEVSPIDRLAYDHGDWQNPKQFEAVITFEETEGGTLVTLRTLFPNKEARDFAVKEIGAIEGGQQTLARLDDYLSTP